MTVIVQQRRDRWFFPAMAIAAALTVFVGFARTYYLKDVFESPALSSLLHIHGILFTLWILLFVTQTSLIAASRSDIHMRLGIGGFVLALFMILVGYLVAVEGARLGHSPPWAPPPLVFLSVPLGAIVTFAVLVGAGLYNRHRSATHKRLMLLATITLLSPAIARMPVIGGKPQLTMLLTSLFVVVCMLYDRATHGRVHPAFLWGGLFVIASLPLRAAIGRTDAWLPFARWVTQ
jgi:hypothetical protein